MDIERINENTVKFYISYIDIEKRGFSRDEIWFNRDKSEELFWEMMDEINDESDFEIEGPLWIQVHAMDKGLEVTVTRAQINKDGKRMESPYETDDKGHFFSNISESSTDEQSFDDYGELYGETGDITGEYTFLIKEFDDLIPMAKRIKLPSYVSTALFVYNNRYYLHVLADKDEMNETEITNIMSILSEYASQSTVTIHRMQEYGKEIMADQVFEQVLKHFS
ncbi:MAG: adaptor protein MecA [Paenisporosarcina sp.]